MAMVNMNNLLNGKDSRWLQLEVCREFQRNKCTRSDTECKFAHPPANVEVQNGRVTACYDSIKGRCNREKPPCKYFHPPQHLKDQLLINGRNHLALKNALMQQMGLTPPGQALIPGQVPAVVDGQMEYATPLMLGQHIMATNPYLAGMPQVGSTFSPYFTPGPVMPTILGPDPSSVASPLSVVPQSVVAQQKMPRSDRLEMDMKSVGSFYYDSFAFPGMMPYKRPAADKSGMPVYQPSATTYQQLMQPFVPVSCEYSTPVATVTSSSASPGGSAPGDELPSEVDKLPPASSEQAKVGVNPVVALNYTGITLNKQTVAVPPPPQPRYPASMPTMTVANPYHQHAAGLLAYSRAANPTFVSPYSFMRPQFMQSPFTMMPQAQGPLLHNGLLANVMSPYTSMTTPVTSPMPTPSNNNNNNTIMSASVALQPYKKMKTT